METIASPPRRGLGRRIALAIAALVLLGLIAWAIFGRRQSALDQWMAEMRARGEKFTLEELGLNRPARTNEAMEVIEVTASRFKTLERAKLSARFLPAEEFGAGERRVAWAGTNLHSVKGHVFDWGAFGRELVELRPVLASVQQVMRNPPLDSGSDYSSPVRTVSLVAIREVAQSLSDAIMFDLHSKDLSSADQDLAALIGMAHLHTENMTLVEQMIRSAIAWLVIDATWNALQERGWTGEQLANLQDKYERLSFFKETAQSFRVERAVGLHWFDLARSEETSPLSGKRDSSSGNLWERTIGWFWKSMWMDQDLLLYAQHCQRQIDFARKLTEGEAFFKVAPELESARENLERKLRGPFKHRYLLSAIAIPNTSRAFDNLVKNETLRQLAIAALALKRFELRHAKLPRDLTELQPEFLRDLSMDFYDGKPVRYRLKGGGTFILYSVGPDFRDDGGEAGKDLIWPKPLWPAGHSQ